MDLCFDFIAMIQMWFCVLDTIHHTAYTKLESKLPDALPCMLPCMLWSTLLIALDCTLSACLAVRSQLLSMAHSQPVWHMLSTILSRYSQVHLQVHSQVHSQACSPGHSQLQWIALTNVSCQDAFKHTPTQALKFTPNSTRWQTPGLLDYTFPTQLSRLYLCLMSV